MPCKCDPEKSDRRGKCTCDEELPLPGGSPKRALSDKKCPRNSVCGAGLPDHSTPRKSSTVRMEGFFPDLSVVPKKRDDTAARSVFGPGGRRACVSLESRRRAPCSEPAQIPRRSCPATGDEPPMEEPPCMRDEARAGKPVRKRSSVASERCKPSRVVKGSCGTPQYDGTAALGGFPAKIVALEKTLSKTQWHDEEGYHSASVTMTQIYRPEDRLASAAKTCGSEKRRNYLRAKLRELMGEARPIPEAHFPEGTEAKPEPEVVAAALLMSEGEGNDLGTTRPDNVFRQLFSSSSPDRAVALASAAPDPMSNLVVPLTVQGRKPPSLDLPNPEKMIQKSRGVAAPNPNVFHDSDTYGNFSEHLRDDIAARSPAVADVPGYLGESNVSEDFNEAVLDYVIRPEPPSYRNRVRLNGSVRPSWFPGYAVVSPIIPGCIRLSHNPGDALRDAWCLCRPRHFDELSKSLVNTG